MEMILAGSCEGDMVYGHFQTEVKKSLNCQENIPGDERGSCRTIRTSLVAASILVINFKLVDSLQHSYYRSNAVKSSPSRYYDKRRHFPLPLVAFMVRTFVGQII